MAISHPTSEVTGEYVTLDGEQYFRISNSHLMPDFFMSLVGASDHWMFISSNGALTAGRQNADNALFQYATDDQISAARSETGSATLVRLTSGDDVGSIWEPFAPHAASQHAYRRNLYKTPLGNKLVFEEISETLNLAFRYRWTFSRKFGFVRSCRLENLGDSEVSCELLDGLRNILPYGVSSEFMMRFSNLGNAYKKSELVDGSDLALFLLSSIPTDRAEPSEGLKVTTVWQSGLQPNSILLSSEQLPTFRAGGLLQTEVDVRGKAGAFLLNQPVQLAVGAAINWHVVAELAQDHTDVISLHEWLRSTTKPAETVAEEIAASQRDFMRIVSSSDGMQVTANNRRTNRHLSNTVFNVMRGGLPLDNYRIHADDFVRHIAGFNRLVGERHAELLDALPDTQPASALCSQIEATGDPDLIRLATEYLPLAFSRRHGDPTRPWNRFSIDLRSRDGRTNLNYQGNWRDIFQNWEALAVSFPEFTTAMICRFVNATTADGYNPYRVTKDGFEWEEPTPDDPWANIGYWGDHQVIYLLRLLEWNRRVDPQRLDSLLHWPTFVHANVPYRIRDFDAIKRDPQSTIEFDFELSRAIAERVAEIGSDGKLLRNRAGDIHHVTLLEKLLTLSLAKLSNFVPDGGIWLNTQRPEWNDANNALVGHGLSVVTACYLHRWFSFLLNWFSRQNQESFRVSREVAEFLRRVCDILDAHLGSVGEKNGSGSRSEIVTALSRAGSDYRAQLYDDGVSGSTTDLSREDCLGLFNAARQHLEATIHNNRRLDGLFHAYNLLDWRDDGIEIEHLYEMLEGQVAVLSSGLLSASEAVEVLDALRGSALYRENQSSYLLYPDRQLPRFLEKNQIPLERIENSPLLQQLLEDDNRDVVRRDVRGGIHFNGSFRNAADLKAALGDLPEKYQTAVARDALTVSTLFKELFGHRQFTGRSGTFFAYEGLGSIYWHMVSKLGLAVMESFFDAVDSNAAEHTIAALRDHFRAIRRGIGAEKSPTEYGAFPSDPYSHTPENAGVKQPGMTGQAKEDILSRFAELGVCVKDGCLGFRFDLFDRSEFLSGPQEFTFCNLAGEFETIRVPASGFALTLCQVPIILKAADADTIRIHLTGGDLRSIDGLEIDAATSRKLFSRSGEVRAIECCFKSRELP